MMRCALQIDKTPPARWGTPGTYSQGCQPCAPKLHYYIVRVPSVWVVWG
jgi:hypothetical protein